MYRKLAVLAAILNSALVTPVIATADAAQRSTVTTSLSFIDPPGFACDIYQGELRARFRATPTASGAWTVDAAFRPNGLLHLHGCFNPPNPSHVHGTASALMTAMPGETMQLSAPGLRFEGQRPIVVVCSISLESDGQVTVHDLWLEAGINP